MKRKTKRESKNVCLPFGGKLSSFMEWFNEKIKEYGPDAIIDIEIYDEHMESYICFERPETDKEVEDRKKREEAEKAYNLKLKKQREEREKKEYARLKKKFEEGIITEGEGEEDLPF